MKILVTGTKRVSFWCSSFYSVEVESICHDISPKIEISAWFVAWKTFQAKAKLWLAGKKVDKEKLGEPLTKLILTVVIKLATNCLALAVERSR